MNALRVRHLENCLNQYDRVSKISFPLDRYLITYFKAHPKIASSDKVWISEQAYELVRWKGLIDQVCPSPVSWQSRLKTFYSSQSWKANSQNSTLPENTRVSFPEALYSRIASRLGSKQALHSCFVLNEAPPRFLRVNVGRTTRDRVFRQLLNKGVPVEKCSTSSVGLQLTVQTQLKKLPEYNEGLIEIQDESSQLMALKVKCKPGDKVMDYCCGTGGKATIYSVAIEQTGQLLLYDANPDVLRRAKIRMRKAGMKNARIIFPGDPIIHDFEGKCDWVVCDVPCSGTGSLRRNPELKWLYTDEWLRHLLSLQRTIVSDALRYIKSDGGKLVYMTQSILDEENAHQIRHLCLTHNLQIVEEPFHSLPLSRGMDGFFSCTLEKAGQATPPEGQEGQKENRQRNGITKSAFSSSEPSGFGQMTKHQGREQPLIVSTAAVMPSLGINVNPSQTNLTSSRRQEDEEKNGDQEFNSQRHAENDGTTEMKRASGKMKRMNHSTSSVITKRKEEEKQTESKNKRTSTILSDRKSLDDIDIEFVS